MRTWLYTILFLAQVSYTLAQTDTVPPEVDMQQLIDDIFGTQELDLNYEQLYENFLLILNNPLDLNKVSAEELRLLNFLTENQINSFLEYRTNNGRLMSVYELQSIPSFDLITLQRLQPFVRIQDTALGVNKSFGNRILHNENNYTIMRYRRLVEQKKGFHPDTRPEYKFRGSPDHLYYRFRTSLPGDFSFGLTLEKDEGEKMQWNPPKQVGFDFLSFHAQIMNKGKLKNLIIGDYQVQAGQGLILGGLFGMGKGGETITSVRRSNVGGMPYTSSYENGYLRGVLATYELRKNFYVTGFISNAKRDGNLGVDSVDNPVIASLQTTGLHRNERELKGKGAIREINAGGILNYKTRKIDAGLIWNTIDFEFPINRNRNNYNQFTFQEKTAHNGSVFLHYNLNNFALFSEVANSFSGGMAMVGGFLGSITTKLDISMLYRNYERNYHTFYANGFGESSTLQNEAGIYWGWKYRWNKKFSLAGYTDIFRFPWLRFRSYAPSEGHEWLLRFNYQPDRNTLIYAQIREESKSRNTTADNTPLYLTHQGLKRNYLIQFQSSPHPALRFKSRVQFSTLRLHPNTTKGFAIIQDARWKKGRVVITGRYALFDTEDYDNRQYVFEDNVWLAFSLPAYYGRGIRNYLMLEYKMNRNLTGWVRYSRTHYTDREIIGSGYDSTEGNRRNDILFQLRIKL